MDAQQRPEGMSIGRLGHHAGLHVSVNLEGKTVGGVLFETEHWLPGVVVGSSAAGAYVTIKLDTAVGGEGRHGLLHRKPRGQDLVSIDDPLRVRPMTLVAAQPEGVPEEIIGLVRAGKTIEAIKRYRAWNGATLDEARAAIARL